MYCDLPSPGTCCSNLNLYGSVQGVATPQPSDIATMYKKSGDKGCGIMQPSDNITTCQLTHVVPQIVGVTWNVAGGVDDGEVKCMETVVGEEMYRVKKNEDRGKEGKVYVVSKGKMEELIKEGKGNEGLWRDDEAMLEWFKKYADMIMDDDRD